MSLAGEVTQVEKQGKGTGQQSRVTLAKGVLPGEESWVSGLYGTRLRMGGGTHCPPIRAGRSTELVFKCALEDRLLSMEEFETCAYVAEMATPAACSENEDGLPPFMPENDGSVAAATPDDRLRL